MVRTMGRPARPSIMVSRLLLGQSMDQTMMVKAEHLRTSGEFQGLPILERKWDQNSMDLFAAYCPFRGQMRFEVHALYSLALGGFYWLPGGYLRCYGGASVWSTIVFSSPVDYFGQPNPTSTVDGLNPYCSGLYFPYESEHLLSALIIQARCSFRSEVWESTRSHVPIDLYLNFDS
ncbi:hypothetical protein MTR67_043554 [Solanum verrucosum]|uniref:Uncharacterized protein n=1 Tax=Solanum verrucosum TaxID=315347 RepID=A0AAF0UQH5_SOLVR|nr:hypothetical protein MTR67_043554 [Solanum verrucosum]